MKSKYLNDPPAAESRSPFNPGELALAWPSEFSPSILESLDRRFAFALLGSLLLHVLTIAYLLTNPPDLLSEKEVSRMQKQFADLVLQNQQAQEETKFVEVAPLTETPAATESAPSASSSSAPRKTGGRETSGGRTTTGGGSPSGAANVTNTGASGTGGNSRAQLSSDVGRSGILGLLTSSSGNARGAEAEDVLGSGNTRTNLDEALSQAGGVKRGSGKDAGEPLGGAGSGRDIRGGRETGAGNIDTMVEGLGEGKSKGVARSGNIEFQEEAPLIETGEGGGSGGRSQDAVAAIVSRHTAAIQSCYQSEVRRTPELKGKIVVRFVITPQGTVESATIVSSTLNNPRVEKCVISRILRWDDFGAVAPDKGNATIRQVYTFGY